MRLLLLGGTGYLGGKMATGLKALPGCEVVIGARRPPPGGVRVDLSDESTFPELRGFDGVVNAADTVQAPPDAAIAYALREGLTWVETASEPLFMRRMLDRYRRTASQGGEEGKQKGKVILGAGIFTGLSNLLAAEAAFRASPCRKLELGIAWSVLSAGGGGMVNLVGHLLGVPTVRYVGGKPVTGPEAEAGPVLPFPSGDRATLHVAFSEPSMLVLSTGVPEVATYAGLKPSLLRPIFLWTPLWLLKTRLMRGWLWLQFTLIRRVFLRAWHSSVEMVAVAYPQGGGPPLRLSLSTDSGNALGGFAVAAMMEGLVAGMVIRPGVHLCDEVFRLEPVLDRAKDLSLGRVSARLFLS